MRTCIYIYGNFSCVYVNRAYPGTQKLISISYSCIFIHFHAAFFLILDIKLRRSIRVAETDKEKNFQNMGALETINESIRVSQVVRWSFAVVHADFVEEIVAKVLWYRVINQELV